MNTKAKQNKAGPVNSKSELITRLKNSGSNLDDFGVDKLGIFGSFKHDTQSDDSDVDFLVSFKPGQKTFDNFMALHDFLSELTRRKIELVTKQSLSAHIGPHITADTEYVTFSN